MMTVAIVLVLVGLAVWLARRSDEKTGPYLPPTLSADRDGERQLAELRAMACSHADVRIS